MWLVKKTWNGIILKMADDSGWSIHEQKLIINKTLDKISVDQLNLPSIPTQSLVHLSSCMAPAAAAWLLSIPHEEAAPSHKKYSIQQYPASLRTHMA